MITPGQHLTQQMPQIADGAYIVIKMPSTRRIWRLPVSPQLRPTQVIDFLTRPEFAQFQQLLEQAEAQIDMEMYRGGYCERSAAVKPSGMSLQQMSPQQQPQIPPMSIYEQDAYPNGDQILQNLAQTQAPEPMVNPQQGFASQPQQGYLPTMDLLHERIGKLKRQVFNLESLAPLLHNMAPGTPEEQAIRELLLQSEKT